MKPNSVIKDLLECPVCMTFMSSPIYQCCNGHTICSTCKGRVDDTCPTCRVELGNIRNIALEKLAELLDLPCKFRELGCQGIFPCPNRARHEEGCSFRPYNCPDYKCSNIGDVTSLVAHLKERHYAIEIDGSTFNCDYSINALNERKDNIVWSSCIINCFNHQFFIHFEYFNLERSPVYMAFLRLMGEETEAKEFRYCLEVGGKERLMSWEGIPRSIRESDRVVRDSLDGLIIQKKNLVLFFTGDDGKHVKVSGRIWRKREQIIKIKNSSFGQDSRTRPKFFCWKHFDITKIKDLC